MKQVKILLLTLAVSAVLIALLIGSASPVLAISASDQYKVSLTCPMGDDVYWASYADYTAGLLSINYTFTNTSSDWVYNLTLDEAHATQGVTLATNLPIWMGDLAQSGSTNPSDSATIKIKWIVPTGVNTAGQVFGTHLKACYTCDSNICVGEETDDGGINIKPGSCPNSVHIGGGGNVAVAVYSYGDFDATELITGTVRFNTLRGSGALADSGNAEDVNGDGVADMVFHFKRNDPNLDLLETDTRACLNGLTAGGDQFRSCDSVNII